MIPEWPKAIGFNIKIRNDITVTADKVCYLPTINAPATNLSTVIEILKQSDAIRKALNLAYIIVTMDQVLYAKAAEIIWTSGYDFSRILLRLGVLHTLFVALSILGRRFQDSGF